MGVKTALLVLFGAVVAVLLYNLLSSPTTIPHIKDGWYGRGATRSPDDPKITPFTVNVSDDVLTDLKLRLERTRYADEVEDTAFHYGFPSSTLEGIIRYWRTDYDWRKHEAVINSFPQYVTQIEGIDVHFLRVPPPSGIKPGKKPVMIVHGWPGSVWEFYKLIPRLTQPEKYGGRPEDAVEVICPSIPGYGFSEKPHQKGFSQIAAARIFAKLMTRLGYEDFYLQGGDWGAVITVFMSQVYPSRVLGLHLNLFPTSLFEPKSMIHQFAATLAPSLLLDKEDQKKIMMLSDLTGILRESGYMHIQATRPDTVGKGLNDSPAGLAAYILEKFSVWTNPDYLNLDDGGLTKKYSLDELLTNVMIYWVTGTITSSQRFYKEYFMDENIKKCDRLPVTVPTGLADFPHELFGAPKALMGYRYKNVIQYTTMPDGGHFAAFEQPELLANDILNFLRKLNNRK